MPHNAVLISSAIRFALPPISECVEKFMQQALKDLTALDKARKRASQTRLEPPSGGLSSAVRGFSPGGREFFYTLSEALTPGPSPEASAHLLRSLRFPVQAPTLRGQGGMGV